METKFRNIQKPVSGSEEHQQLSTVVTNENKFGAIAKTQLSWYEWKLPDINPL